MANAPAAQNCQTPSHFLADVNISPTSNPRRSIAIVYLFSNPSPATAPAQSQLTGASRPMLRTAKYTHPAQSAGSNAFMVSRWCTKRYAGDTSTAIALNPCANRPPPISRVMLPVSHTSKAPASAGINLRAKSDSPKEWRATSAIKAINGG